MVCKVLTGAGLVRRTLKDKINSISSTLTHPTVTCTTIPTFNNAYECFKIFTSLDMKRKEVPDFRLIKSKTFFPITNLIDFGNTEI